MDEFLKRCFFHSGQYNSEEHFVELDSKLKEKEVLVIRLLVLFCVSDLLCSVLCTKIFHFQKK